jgi:tetratricopeptide (TPR) repeat protein
VLLLGACASAPEKPEPETISEETRAAYQEALALMQEDAYEEAIEALRGVSKRNDTLAGPYVNIGIAYRELGETDKAREAFDAAIERDPANGAAYNQLGLLHRKAGRFQEARDAYAEGIDENPEYAGLYRNLGILCDIYLQDLQCALESFRAYQERTEDNDEQIKRWIADVERRAQ